ncbi:MAG: adenylosuccinate lyase [Firmicutes bacterium]|nr:adenylosuccinate lyase [Bacillota bacterium]
MIERYTRPVMGRLWSDENRFRKWLEIEVAACEAWASLGVIPADAARRIRERASFSLERVRELERQVEHEVIAFVTAVAETVGEDGRYLHYGLTSSDVMDTALSCLMVEALDVILGGVDALGAAVREKALRYKDTVIMGRTHGVHAEPTTFGLKLALWWAELGRQRERLIEARRQIAVGKLSGAVGNFAHLDPRVEEYVCRQLGLEPAPISSQVLSRDRHAHYLCTLANLAASIEKFALEIRGLARSEVREVEEPFRPGQKGSSAMPHKRNPILSERMCGLARLVRSYSVAALENVALWHERDISHSSVERVVIPDATTAVDYMLHTFTRVVEGLRVYPERMAANVYAGGGLAFSERVLLALVERGMSREEAYGVVQELALRALDTGASFRELVEADPRVTGVLEAPRLAACFDLGPFLARVDYIFDRLGLRDGRVGAATSVGGASPALGRGTWPMAGEDG